MKRISFGQTADGQPVDLISFENQELKCAVTTYGGALVSLEVLDAKGEPRDVVLGFDDVPAYEAQDKFIGALIGRFANRIGGSRFTLSGEEYKLYPNEAPNHLHGGKQGFDKKIWRAEEIKDGLRLSLTSPHMDEGYPGNLEVSVSYVLEGSALAVKYNAVCDKDTVCSLTNHSYFNLDGHGSGRILDHVLMLKSEKFTPVSDSRCIPTGELAEVKNTPMDFRKPTRVGQRIDEDYQQLILGSGYDHNWEVTGESGTLRRAAEIYSPESGIVMSVDTTMPGIQFYTGNFLDNCPTGKGGAVYRRRDAFCLETQFYPDSPNNPDFPQPVLKKGETWAQETVFSFSVL